MSDQFKATLLYLNSKVSVTTERDDFLNVQVVVADLGQNMPVLPTDHYGVYVAYIDCFSGMQGDRIVEIVHKIALRFSLAPTPAEATYEKVLAEIKDYLSDTTINVEVQSTYAEGALCNDLPINIFA